MPTRRGSGSSYQTPTKQQPSTSKSPLKSHTPTPRSGSSKRKSCAPKRSNNQSRTVPARKRRYRPGRRALQEIKTLQGTTKLCIRKLPFSRLVREIQQRQNRRITHWQVEAMAALQEAAEAYLVRFLEDCNEAAHFANRVTIMLRDFQFINKIRGRSGTI